MTALIPNAVASLQCPVVGGIFGKCVKAGSQFGDEAESSEVSKGVVVVVRPWRGDSDGDITGEWAHLDIKAPRGAVSGSHSSGRSGDSTASGTFRSFLESFFVAGKTGAGRLTQWSRSVQPRTSRLDFPSGATSLRSSATSACLKGRTLCCALLPLVLC